MRVNLKEQSLPALESLFADLGEPTYRALQVYRRIHRHRASRIDEITELSRPLRARLADVASLPSARLVHRAVDAGGTEKFILDVSVDESAAASGPRQVEAVWIVSGRRRTVCLSSQSGCSLDCIFCATGTLPFAGNLACWQMLDQVYSLERLRSERATNIVFMGMGEPFHNYDSVLRAAHTLADDHGAHLGARRITISTAGIVPAIERFTDERQPFKLAISLNHPHDEGRSSIMAINSRYPLADLLAAARRYTRVSGRRVTFEYVMMAGFNMFDEHLNELVRIGRSMPCKLNLIPLNVDLGGLRRPSPEDAEDFRRRLGAAGVKAFNRGSPGRGVGGACGMLALAVPSAGVSGTVTG